MAITLPTKPIPAETQDPKYLILFGLPKVGKTTALAQLPNNLILDFENGSKYVDALKYRVNSLKELKEVVAAIKEAKCPYKYITLDTITAIEEMCKPAAIARYRASSVFSDKYADITDITRLPNGQGYTFLREVIESVISLVASVTENIIICGHVKDTSLSEGMDGSVKDLDLAGKAKRILSAKSDAIGWVHRDDDGNLCVSFGTDGEILTGARPKHLACKDIIVAERTEDGDFISHWDRIFPSEAK